MNKRDAAVALAKQGFRVFPCAVGDKKPVVANFPDLASSDPAKVYDWWTEPVTGEPRHNNIGVSTDDLLVLDFDVKKGAPGLADLANMEAKVKLRHMAETTTGGYHAYLRLPEGVKVSNTTKPKIGPATDSRSWHGYVLGPGSEIDGKFYSWVEASDAAIPASIADLDEAPQWLIDKCGAPRERESATAEGIEWDTPAAVAAATDYLKRRAPIAVSGQGGNGTTYRVAARARDFAVSRECAVFLMLDHWNERCEPPWAVEELDRIVDHAYQYGAKAPHEPGSEFEAVTLQEKAAKPVSTGPWPKFEVLEPFDPATIPPRKWVVEGVLAKGFLTILSAPPGAGKTQWLAQLMLGVAFNNEAVAGHKIKEAANVWSFNAEDDVDEMKRRIGAGIIGYGLKWDQTRKNIGIGSGVERSLIVAKWDAARQCVVENKPAVDALISQIVENRIGVLIADPMAELHGAPESSNDAMKVVSGIFRRIAVITGCSVMIAAHTRKPSGTSSEGTAGNQDTLRGAGAQAGVARIMLTLVSMSAKDAKAYGVKESDRSDYVRLDGAKSNLGKAGRGAVPDWFKWEGVPLGNSDATGNSDVIGVLRKADLTGSRVERVEDEDAGSEIKGKDGNEIEAAIANEMDGETEGESHHGLPRL